MTEKERNTLRETVGYIYNHESFGTVDGPGVRYVFFLQGCPLRCIFCHNPDSVAFHGGEEWTAGKVVDTILEYRFFIQKGGVTLSGGEPLAQPEFCIAIMKLLKEEHIHIALDTSAAMPLSNPLIRECIDLCDLVLLDIKSIDPDTCVRISGKDATQAFEMLEYCEQTEKPVWIRQVLLREYTLNQTDLENLAKKLSTYQCIEQVELLPFHKLGEPKWDDVDRPYLLRDIDATTKEETLWAKEIFSAYGLKVQ